MRLTDSFGYFNDDAMWAGVIDEYGDLHVTIQVGMAPKGTYPLRKPNEVKIVITRETLPMIKQWFSHLETNYGVTYINNKLVPGQDKSNK
jgi:hypothetical protein